MPESIAVPPAERVDPLRSSRKNQKFSNPSITKLMNFIKALGTSHPKRWLPQNMILAKTVLVMKLTIILLIAGCLQVSAKGYGQKITISGKDLPLEKVFSMVRNQTGYVFFYDY